MEYEVESCIRGYHIYKDQWTSYVGESLSCNRETDNTKDPYAVCVVKGHDMIVGHVPRKISAACSLFLRGNGTITCIVTAARRFSVDLPQGGLEVPCKLVFKGPKALILKIKKLVLPLTPPAEEPPCKKRKVDTSISHDDVTIDLVSNSQDEFQAPTSTSLCPHPWISLDGYYHLNENDKSIILSGGLLTDKHMNFAQGVLKKQFPGLNGLQCTLLLPKQNIILSPTNYLQIVHTRNNHWMVLSTLGCLPNQVKIYDSLYSDVEEQTTGLIRKLFGSDVSYEVHSSPRQEGYSDCGVFAIANCVSLVNWCEPKSYAQEKMRPHLMKCFEQCSFTQFPII